MSRPVRLALTVLLPAVFLPLGWNAHYRAVKTDENRTDFLMLREAGRALLDGKDMYEVAHPRGWRFYYPPAMAVLMVPFAELPIGVAALLWFAIGAVSLCWAGARLVRLCDQLAAKPVGQWVLLAFLVNCLPIASGLQRGQVSAVLFALMVEGFWAYREGRSGRAGMWIGIACALKLYPALVALPLIVRRDGRGLLGFGLTLVVAWMVLPALLMGPSAAYDSLHHWTTTLVLPFLGDSSFAQQEMLTSFNQFSRSNQSLFGVLARWFAGGSLPDYEQFAWSVANWPVDRVRLIAMILSVGLCIIMVGTALAVSSRRGWSEAVVWCLPMVACNLISHIGWHHYFTVLVMPYALGVTALVMLRPSPARSRLAWGLALAVPANWLYFGVMLCRSMGLLMISSLALWLILAWQAVFSEGREYGRLADDIPLEE